jgi:hypothetical protein
MPSGVLQDECEIAQGGGVAGLCRQSRSEQISRFGASALLVEDESQQVLGVELICIGFENLPAQPFRLGEVSALLTAGGAIQDFGGAGHSPKHHRAFGNRLSDEDARAHQRSRRTMPAAASTAWVRQRRSTMVITDLVRPSFQNKPGSTR